jgi:ribosomal protein S12 methylthiotransferase accessory factor
VTRCAEITWLDRIGIPVFSATRPDAAEVVVTAGKGRSAAEARAGALMESIEQAVAERSIAAIVERGDIRWETARQAVREGGFPLGAFCPTVGRRLDADERVAWIVARDMINATEVLVPAELVMFPCPPEFSCGIWGSTTTGLASGNTWDEAVLHGLCEVLERNAVSFEIIAPSSLLVVPDSLPYDAATMFTAIREVGLNIWLRAIPSDLGACFCCMIADDEFLSPLACNGGYGFHPVAAIAAVRAIAEAAQSRLSFIQGARDDLGSEHIFLGDMSDSQREAYRHELIYRYSRDEQKMFFSSMATVPARSPTTMLAELAEKCQRYGLGHILVYQYPDIAAPFTVVRVVLPYAECFVQETMRVGPRLAAFVDSLRKAKGGELFQPARNFQSLFSLAQQATAFIL